VRLIHQPQATWLVLANLAVAGSIFSGFNKSSAASIVLLISGIILFAIFGLSAVFWTGGQRG